jgi:hypothetical protein
MISRVMRHDDVPLVVDSVAAYESFPIVRCNYLSIECDSPEAGWTIRIGRERLPFLMLGLVGIVTRPFVSERFTSIDLIEDLFKRTEAQAGLVIHVDDIWLPMGLFDRINPEPASGRVYRIKTNLFVLALAFREGRLDPNTFRHRCARFKQPLVFSENETRPFREWRGQQIQNAKDQYPKNRELELRWRE